MIMRMAVTMSMGMVPTRIVRCVFQVKPQQIDTEVVSIRRADSRVDVEPFRQRIIKYNTPMMIELNHRDRALDAIIKDAALFGLSGPTELGLGLMPLKILHFCREWSFGQRLEIAFS